MGAYLSQPNTVKCSGDGVGASRLSLPYGFSAMQGWRVSMEVRRQRPIGWLLAVGREPDRERERGGWGHPRGRVRIWSLWPQRQFGGRQLERASGREGAARCLGTVPVVSLVARARPCAERYLLPPTALSPCLRAVLVPSQPFRLVNSVRFNVGVKLKSGTKIFEGRQ